MFLQDTVFEETFWLPLTGFDINLEYIYKAKIKTWKFAEVLSLPTEFRNFFKLERKKVEIGKYLIIQKYEMVYVRK